MKLLAPFGRVLFCHAHPDDETISTGALIAELIARGREVGVVTATRGEQGEIRPGVLEGSSPEEFVAHREGELARALEALGVREHWFLGTPPARAEDLSERRYQDSGMRWIREGLAGPGESAGPDSFTAGDQAEVVADLVALIERWQPGVLVSYDNGGGYGHPDHLRMHHVAKAAAAATGLVFLEVIEEPDADGDLEVVELPGRLTQVSEALGAYASQLRVDGDAIVHVGGQRQPITLRVGLRRG